MKVVNFPVICAICNKRTTARKDWIIFNEKKKEYMEDYLCAACSDKEEERMCTVSRGTMEEMEEDA